MFREIITNKILGVVIYNPEMCRWRFISSKEYNKETQEVVNVYDF